MTKQELRKRAKLERKALSGADAAAYSQELVMQFSLLDLSEVKTLHTFLPIAEQQEPNTFLIIDWLTVHHPDIKIIVPRADFDTSLMANIVYEGQETLSKNEFNILEPQKGTLHDGDVDLVLVPMLAFDLKGYRVGYGKGFYDRFLQDLNTLKVGLSLFEPVSIIDDVDVYDIPLDLCITPKKTYNFKD